jgi:drug/metabolite transporter (DMT)-like permease
MSSRSVVSLRYLALPLLTILIWSGNIAVTKLSAGAIHPSVIAFTRWLLALVLLTPFLLPTAWRQRRQVAQHLPQLAVLGVLGMAVYQGLAYYAAASISATVMGLFAALLPLLTLALSTLILGEAPGLGMIAGGLLSILGMVLLLTGGHPAALLHQGLGLGHAMMLVACLAYATYIVLLRRWVLGVTPWVSLYMQILFATLSLLPGYLMAPAAPLTWGSAAMILYAGIPTSIVAPFLWMQAVRHLGPSRTSIFINLTPVMTAVIAVIFLHETLHAFDLVGGALILAGVVLAQRAGTRPLPAPAKG